MNVGPEYLAARKSSWLKALIAAALCASIASAQTGQEPKGKAVVDPIQWQNGPVTVSLGNQAQLKVPEGYAFADKANTIKFLERTQNIPSGNELGTLIPLAKGKFWFVQFEFEPVGYVKDDEKDSLDAQAILDTITKATEAANEERGKRGWGEFHITGWIDPPHYDLETHQLTWSLRGRDEKGEESANYRTRLLGRRGVMSVELVTSPENLTTVLPEFRQAATGGYSFTPDNRYASFVKGDKVAEYGLSALIVGGVAAAAVKTGLFKYLLGFLAAGWKFIVAGLAAASGAIKRFFSRPKAVPPAAAAEDNHPTAP